MDNFYEALDNIFETIIQDDCDEIELLDLKSQIIKAYQQTKDRRSKYLVNMIKPKTFKICDNGIIERIK